MTSAATKSSKSINLQKFWYTAILVAWTVFAFTISQFVIGIPMALLLHERFAQTVWTGLYFALVYVLTVLLVIFVPSQLVRFYKGRHVKTKVPAGLTELTTTSPNQLGLNQYPTFVDLGLFPIAYIVYLVLASIALNFMSIFSWFDATQAQNTGFTFFVTTGERIIAILALVFIAPIAEEIIMRGWLYGKLRNKLKVPVAMIIVSILFALLHGQWNVGVSVLILSFILCGLRELTGTIWCGIFLHILVNGIAFYVSYSIGF